MLVNSSVSQAQGMLPSWWCTPLPMLVNSSVSQAQGCLGDLKTALYLGVRPAAMFQAQLLLAAPLIVVHSLPS